MMCMLHNKDSSLCNCYHHKTSMVEEEPAKPSIQTVFVLGQKVMIKDINRRGVIKAIILDSLGVQYQVHYWDNSSRETTWLFAEELE